MKIRRTSGILFLALASFLMTSHVQAQESVENEPESVASGASVSVEPESGAIDEVPVSVDADLSSASLKQSELGNWFWSLSSDPVLLAGASAVGVDGIVPTTLYAGGSGYIAVSSDGGENWVQSMSFSNTLSGGDEEDPDGSIEDEAEDEVGDSAQRIELLKEYLRSELEQQFGSSYADSLIEDMTDDELLRARDVQDIEVLENLDLTMDPDLTQVQTSIVSQYNSVVTEFDSFRTRYDAMISAGAQESVATVVAGSSTGVWSFVSSGSRTYAVTSMGIYLTGDLGKNWRSFVSSPSGSSMLSMAVSSNGQLLAIGMTSGLMISRNGGNSWVELNDVISGSAYEVFIVPNDGIESIVVMTTEALYESRDEGLTWSEVEIPFSMGEKVLNVLPGENGRMIALSNVSIYYRDSALVWKRLNTAPFADETVRQVVAADASLSRITVRTDAHVFELDESGWKSQLKGLFTNEVGPLAYAASGNLYAIMASSSGVWLAQNAEEIEAAPEYKALMKQWESEPSDELVIEKALMAHYINGWVDDNWSIRARLSWLLPTLTFDYSFKQQRTDTDKRVYEGAPGYIEGTTVKYFKSEDLTFKRQEDSYWQIMALWKINIEKGQRDEIFAKSTMEKLVRSRERLIKQVNAELKKRRAYQIKMAKDAIKNSTKKSVKLTKRAVNTYLGLLEIESHLHYLTDGFYIPAVHQNDSLN